MSNSLPRSALLAAICLGAWGCGPTPGHAPDASTIDAGALPEDSDVGTPPDFSDAGTSSDADEPTSGPGLKGVLRDEGGEVLGKVMVLACMSRVCLFGASESDGRFTFPIDPPADVALKTLENLSVRPRRGAALVPVHIRDAMRVDVGSLYVPSLPDGAPIAAATSDPQTLMAGDGLELTLRRADLTPRLGDTVIDVAARRIPMERVPPLPALGTEEVVALYALHPFAARSRSPIAVRAPSNLLAGTAVNFRVISEIDGQLSAPAIGHADGAFIATDPSVGIDELTWLVISH